MFKEINLQTVNMVSIVTDTVPFGLDFAYIIEESDGYRLIVHDHKEKCLFERKFKKMSFAKIGFLHYFGDKYTQGGERPKPEWSELHAANQRWKNEKIQFIRSLPEVYKKAMKSVDKKKKAHMIVLNGGMCYER